jgi:DNA-binding response OmpR family regulator
MTGTVLIVDDDHAVVAVLAEALTEAGFRVRIAYDGQMAMEAISHAGTDLVIADVRMPRLDGHALLRNLRDRPDPVPVLLISAWPGATSDPEVAVISKPFDIDEMIAAAVNAIGHRPIK